MTSARSRSVAVIAGAAALVTLSCQLILGLEEPQGEARPDGAAIDGPAAPVDPCKHASPPGKPALDDDPATERSFWFAVERVVGPIMPDAGGQVGIDLDKSCTCQPDLRDGAPSCETPASKRIACDFSNGVDDSLGSLAIQYAAALPGFDPSRSVNDEIRAGGRTVLLYLKGYNGKANDTDVGVAFVGSGGLYSDLGCNGEPRDAGPPTAYPDAASGLGPQRAPLWDGCDRWTTGPGLLIGKYPNRLPLSVLSGYVADHTLVVELNGVALEIYGVSTRAANGYAVAKLDPERDGFRLDGFISTRLPFADLVNVVGRNSIRTGATESKPVCQTPYWTSAFAALCGARDIMDSPSKDYTGQICDATTATLGFVARAVQVSDDEYENPLKADPCDAAAVTCN